MRKLVLVLSIAAMLAVGAASAQGVGTVPASNLFAGVSAGYEFGGSLVGNFYPIGVHVGIENVVFQHLTLRGDFEVMPGQAFTMLRFGGNILYQYPVTGALSVYGGVGPSLLMGVGSISGIGMLGVRITGGAEYMVTPHVGITAEGNATPYFTSVQPFMFGFTAGVNYHF